MNKYIRLSLIVLLVVIVAILIDTVQARIFKNSPVISFKSNLSDSDSYVDKGIILDTYYCTKDRDIVTVSWHFKTSKFTCSVDNVNDLDEVDGVSMVIKEGTLKRDRALIVITDTSGKKYTYGEEYRIDKYSDGKWEEADIVVDGNYGWNSIGYHVDDNKELELDINWKWLYGSLDKGKYRIVKSVNNKYFSVEFMID